jgi:hypothetical protein
MKEKNQTTAVVSGRKNKSSYNAAIIVAIVAVVLFCVISVLFGVVSVSDLPANYIGAALGSFIGAIITLVLLRGQTDIEEKKGKDIRILEKKTEVFQEYIKEVWKVWEDQKITIEEFRNLTSKYYQNLMIYLKSERLEKIGNCLSAMGECINKTEYKKLRDNIVIIIDELSDEIELGGKIKVEIMKAHDAIVFPLLFRNVLLDEFNRQLVWSNFDLERGQWEIWNESNMTRDLMVFKFKNYPGCSIRFGLVNENKKVFQAFFVIPVGDKYHGFDKFRNSVTGVMNQRIKLNGKSMNFYTDSGQEGDTAEITPFSFSDKESMEKMSESDYRQIAETLAKRAAIYYSTITIGEENLDISSFLSTYYSSK